MTERELLELLLNKVTSMETTIESLEAKIGNLGTTVGSLETKVDSKFDEVNAKLDRLENKVDDLEIKNANRHIDMTNDIRTLKDSLYRLEINTAENWKDIALLKAVGNNRKNI